MLTPLELRSAAAHMRQRIATTTDRVVQRGCMEAADMLESEAVRVATLNALKESKARRKDQSAAVQND